MGTESHQTLRRTDLLGLAMNFQKLFIFTLAGIALSGFSTLPNGVNAASIEDRDATMRGGTETTWIISVPSNFTCEQVHEFLAGGMPTGAKFVYENCFDVEQLTVPATLDVLEDELVPSSKW